jgi:hypothetical protein
MPREKKVAESVRGGVKIDDGFDTRLRPLGTVAMQRRPDRSDHADRRTEKSGAGGNHRINPGSSDHAAYSTTRGARLPAATQ